MRRNEMRERRAERRGRRLVTRLGWVATAWILSSCTSYHQVPIDIPVSAKMDVTRFERVLVAGFVTQTTERVDLNWETVRLLRNQLGNRSSLAVVDADTASLGDFSEGTLEEDGRMEEFKRFQQSLEEEDGEKTSLREWIDLEKDKLLQDEEYWRKLGEEYQAPLIISGSLALTSESRWVAAPARNEAPDAFGRPQPVVGAPRMEATGFVMTAEFYFIDGGTGQILHRELFSEEVVYGRDEAVSSLASYFELMDRVLPNFLSVVSPQKFRQTRFLLN